MKFVQILDTKYAYQVAGAGLPLLLVHGFPLDHRMWREQLPVLSQEFQVLVPDLRGFGESGRGERIYSMRQLAEDLAELALQVFGDQKYCYCGLSMGGYIAWEFLQSFDDRLSHLVLCDTRAQSDDEKTARARRWMADGAITAGLGDVARTMPQRLLGASTVARDPQLVEQLRQWINQASPEAYAEGQRAMSHREDYSKRLNQINVPTLVIVGEEDVISPPDEMNSMANQIPGAQFRVIEQAGHLPPLEQPAEFNQSLLSFLRSSDSERTTVA